MYQNNAAMQRLLVIWQHQDDLRLGPKLAAMTERQRIVERARLYLAKADPAISGQHGHDTTFKVACTLVKGFDLTIAEAWEAIQDWNGRCVPPWADKDLSRKLHEAHKAPDERPRGWLLNSGQARVNGRSSADTSDDPLDQDATARDLIECNATIRWGWEKWLPAGVLTVLASEPGCGKTRFCADLARRVHLGLPWPDGAPASFPAGSTTLWVPADNQHAELGTLPGSFGFPPESLYLNATRRNPFSGTMLDDQADLKDFEARIMRIRPALVFVDTSLAATERSAHKPEDARAFFSPLQQIAARTGVVLVCVTHLNASGKPLGRRIMGQARVVMQLEQPDPDGQPTRRKLYVVKSNSLFPPALGVTMGDVGNEYDADPPSAPEAAEPVKRGPKSDKIDAAKRWLQEALRDGPKRVSYLRRSAEEKGIVARTLYRAKDDLGIEEFEMQDKKWWRLTEE
jgi:hypothetical protein